MYVREPMFAYSVLFAQNRPTLHIYMYLLLLLTLLYAHHVNITMTEFYLLLTVWQTEHLLLERFVLNV